MHLLRVIDGTPQSRIVFCCFLMFIRKKIFELKYIHFTNLFILHENIKKAENTVPLHCLLDIIGPSQQPLYFYVFCEALDPEHSRNGA